MHYYPTLTKFCKKQCIKDFKIFGQGCLSSLQFGFIQNYSTSYAPIHLNETIKQSLGQSLFSCGIFVDLQEVFDTVDHDTLIGKLEHYGIRGIINKWFETYHKDWQKFVSINGYNSECAWMPTGVPQGSVLGPLLFPCTLTIWT